MLAMPGPAPAHHLNVPTAKHVLEYERAYMKVRRQLGRRAPGRNIVHWGMGQGRLASDSDVVRSTNVLLRMLAPPPTPTAPITATAPQTVSSTPVATAGSGGVPACASESGTNYSTGPSNTNASSGATGRYQIIPSTASAYGCNLSTPSGQDACAQVIYQHQGAGAWVGCGG